MDLGNELKVIMNAKVDGRDLEEEQGTDEKTTSRKILSNWE